MRLLLAIALVLAPLCGQQIIVAKKKPAGGGGTIGYTTQGTTGTDGGGSGLIIASKFTAPANGSNGTLYVYCAEGETVAGVGVYSDSGGNPSTLLSNSNATVTCPVSLGLVSTPITWSGITAGTSYWLAIQSTGSGTGNVKVAYDAGSAGQQAYAFPGSWGGAMPATWPASGGLDTKKYSIYVTY